MKKILLLLLVQSICNANIYDGNTDAIPSPRDLSLNPMDIGPQDSTQTTSVKNYILTNLSTQGRLRMSAAQSQMVLENSTLELDGTFTFTHGSIKVVGNCAINGSSDFNKFRFESHLIHITEGSELRIGPGVNFEYAPTGSISNGIRFGNSSSKLTLEDATLTVSNRLGLNLINGQLRIEGNSTVDNFFTEDNVGYLDTKTSFTETALVLGNGPDSYGDCKLQITSGSKLTVKNAGLIYSNNGAGSFDGANGKGSLVIDKKGSFLIDSSGDFGNGGIGFNFDNLSSQKKIGVLGSVTSLDPANFNGTNVRFCVWTPDSKYLVATGSGSSNEVELFSFDGYQLTSEQSLAYNGSIAFTCAWSLDGKYLAVGGDGTNELEIYSFNGSSLTSIAQISFITARIQICVWSPDGKYIAAGGIGSEFGIYRFDGSSITLISTGSFNDVYVRTCDWSPDGKYLAIGGADDGGYEVEIYSFDGAATLTRLYQGTYGGTSVSSCAWSPNGKYLALGGDGSGSDEVEVHRFDGSSLMLVTTVNFNGISIFYSCSWTPNGKYLSVAGDNSGGYEVEVYKFNGSNFTSSASYRANFNGSYLQTGMCSPDGKFLVGGGNNSGGSEIEVYTLDFLTDDQKLSTFKDTSIKLSKDLTLRNVNLKMQ